MSSEVDIPAKADIVVVGGGPAGSHASTLMAQRGFDVVLLEKARHPRPMVGESLIPHFWKFMDMSGATPKIEEAGYLSKAGGITVWNGRIHQFSLLAKQFKSRKLVAGERTFLGMWATSRATII
ncbi:hypothetical protein MNBD_CHLOROFLEXI01-1191 [hydrothermal vent metagenome]|uniref:FAD-binding domain-containing protein n=1 Tax=hydrothermal vent metagenome TaxID=652676 RepID=A0A3B0V4G0_9ZZZZ